MALPGRNIGRARLLHRGQFRCDGSSAAAWRHLLRSAGHTARRVLAWCTEALITWGCAIAGIPPCDLPDCRPADCLDNGTPRQQARRGIREIERYLASHRSAR